ncbi:MAG: hypothetical protein A4E61_01227 [Syntrophorhabdus sp. PtaB.Bin184]|jgi:hypothetical protein|nr:MAG: hypothetical protein A4E61_01227 [Syntrophorhabdus sp. PtaB.Bin184]
MEVIYFSKEGPEKTRRLLEAVGRGAGDRRMIAVSDIEEFKRQIAAKRGKENLAVIVAPDEQTLIDVYFARSLLNGVSSVLVLPDQESVTVALGFRIRPDHTLPADAGAGKIAWAVRSILRERGRGYTLSREGAAAGGGTPPDRCAPGDGQRAANF